MDQTTENRTQLINELDTARETVTACGAALRHDLDLSAKFRRGVRAHPWAWFGGAAALGLLLSKIRLTNRKTAVKVENKQSKAEKPAKAAFALLLLKFGLDVAKPVMLRWIKTKYVDRDRALRVETNSKLT